MVRTASRGHRPEQLHVVLNAQHYLVAQILCVLGAITGYLAASHGDPDQVLQ